MMNEKVVPYYFLGYLLAAYLGVPVLGIALLGIILIITKFDFKTLFSENAVEEVADDDF